MYPSNRGHFKEYDDTKIKVLDLEFFSVNQMVHESRVDRRGNKKFGRAKYNDVNKRKNKYLYSYKRLV